MTQEHAEAVVITGLISRQKISFYETVAQKKENLRILRNSASRTVVKDEYNYDYLWMSSENF